MECSKVTVVSTSNNAKIKEQNKKIELTYNTQLQPHALKFFSPDLVPATSTLVPSTICKLYLVRAL